MSDNEPLRPGDNPLADQLIEENNRLRQERNSWMDEAAEWKRQALHHCNQAYRLQAENDHFRTLLQEVVDQSTGDPLDGREKQK